MTALEVFTQNNGDVTKAFYADLSQRGPLGRIAVALFRAQKRSSRAKDYRRGRYRSSAYEVKSWSMEQVCLELTANPNLGFVWGWATDPNCKFGEADSYVLYVDIPGVGQCSFHSPTRGSGPDYPGKWDGTQRSAEHIVQFTDMVRLGRG